VPLSSWVPGADGSGFPAEHLPYGVVSAPGERPRVAVRIGDQALDLARLAADGVVRGPFDRHSLNPFMALGPTAWAAVRERLTSLVCDPAERAAVAPALAPVDGLTAHLPFTVADYVDCYSSIEHATNLGRLFRPDGEPLLPNWRHLPVAYHGRAGTVVVSGTPIQRPWGQRLPPGAAAPVVGPSERLDIELELGVVVGTPSGPGVPVPVAEAPGHVFGVVLVNDWSARDVQAWEYQPLGPFLGKSFATTIGAWVTPLAALDAVRAPGPPQDPEPFPHLRRDPSAPWALALDLAVELCPAGAPAAGEVVTRSSAAGLYWTFPQQLAHLTSNGAHLRTGDLVASGTISGARRGSEGSLIELTRAGAEPLVVAGVERRFLADGDTVTLRAAAAAGPGADAARLTLAEASGTVVPGRPLT